MADLTLNDLIGAVQIIDLAAGRGAFRGEELLPIGTVREHLAQYVKTEQEKAEAADTEKASE
jgi:hypothetical protein